LVLESEQGDKPVRKIAVPVMDEKAQRRLLFINRPDELSCLLHHPCASGMRCTAGEMDAARAKLDEEEHGQGV
jgi:hypothetical protein